MSLVFEQKFTFSSLTTANPPPNNLQLFLHILINGKAERSESEKIELFVSSIGQDLGRAATKGQWSLPKHILLCMTLGYLSRNVKLCVLMNKLSHSESYSFSLKLETALAEALEEAHTILTPKVIQNLHHLSQFCSDFDNFDQLVNDISGTDPHHTYHGIMSQNIPSEPAADENMTHNQAKA